ncbi:MAG: glycosyltransferase [Candidatus Altiarchaeales archaeon]|nr:glycosyltransferase [Candidatus Altiarchaeales archaeon]
MAKQKLGIAMITLNEEFHIPATLAQFYSLNVLDDVVVVDGGSTDDTVSICEKFGARVIHHPFENDFSAQKNRAISALETDWVYLHDPDERLEPTLLDIIPMLINVPEGQQSLMYAGVLPGKDSFFDCFGIARRNFIDGVQTEVYPDYQYRLFRNYCRYKNPVHEEIINFEDRTEVDCSRDSLEKPSRFNILHYKSSVRQKDQNALYAQIEKENS